MDESEVCFYIDRLLKIVVQNDPYLFWCHTHKLVEIRGGFGCEVSSIRKSVAIEATLGMIMDAN